TNTSHEHRQDKAPCKRCQGTMQIFSRHYANIVKTPYKRRQRMLS
ncbi:10739_t:CDS:1, partial [Gigaspora rosea]